MLSKMLLLSTFVTPFAQAMPPEYQVNVREGCRQAVAGGYLKAYDEVQRITEYSAALKEQADQLRKALKQAEDQARTAARTAEQHTYDTNLAAAKDASAGVVHSLRGQLADYDQLLKTNAGQLAGAQAEEKRLRALVERVFIVDRADDKQDGGYPIRVAYRSSCPKYRALCPLAPDERERLAQVKIDGRLPEACQRYVGQSQMR